MNNNEEININSKVLEYIDSSISKNTARAYKSDWLDFKKFCKYKGFHDFGCILEPL